MYYALKLCQEKIDQQVSGNGGGSDIRSGNNFKCHGVTVISPDTVLTFIECEALPTSPLIEFRLLPVSAPESLIGNLLDIFPEVERASR